MPIRYRRISGEDLASGIKAANVTTAQFAALYGVRPKRLEKWLKGEAEIPHSVALFVGLIADPLVLEKALIITQYMVDKSSPPDAQKKRRVNGRDAKAGEAEDGAAEGSVRQAPLRARRPATPPRPAAEARAAEGASQRR
jgi:transcriptional regulator with XRE-family HTH domain